MFARVLPEQKLRIVQALTGSGEVVAMTGDGVNDVPPIRAAHIGIAMGRGTDAARAAADMIITDDNFATIVRAIRRGRAIYENVQRFALFLLSANAGEVLVYTAAIVGGMSAPLTVLQVLLVNLLTDGPPAIALGLDPPGPGVMRGRRDHAQKVCSIRSAAGLSSPAARPERRRLRRLRSETHPDTRWDRRWRSRRSSFLSSCLSSPYGATSRSSGPAETTRCTQRSCFRRPFKRWSLRSARSQLASTWSA